MPRKYQLVFTEHLDVMSAVDMSKQVVSTPMTSSRNAEGQRFKLWPILKNRGVLRDAAVHEGFHVVEAAAPSLVLRWLM
jgi:hypothetical protein